MKFYLYSVYDRVSEQYAPIFQAVKDGVAVRQFEDMVAKIPHADDLSLVKFGFFDNESGEMKAYESAIPVTLQRVAESEVRADVEAVFPRFPQPE